MENPTKYFEGGGHLSEEGVALFVDALKLDTAEQLPAAIREHVADCFECKKHITGLLALLDEEDYGHLKSHPSFELSRRKGRPDYSTFLRIAAIVAGIAVIGALAIYVASEKGGDTTQGAPGGKVEARADSVHKEAGPAAGAESMGKKEFADSFVEDPEYEDLADSRFRSKEIEVVSPLNGSTLEPPIEFRWKGYTQEEMSISLLDNRGKTFFTDRVLNSPYVLRQSLNPGLYYWKLEDESELIHVGKFSVDLRKSATGRITPP